MGLMDQLRGSTQPDLLGRMNALRSMANGNPSALLQHLLRTNPRFAQFYAQNQGKTPEQAFADNGLDYKMYRPYL